MTPVKLTLGGDGAVLRAPDRGIVTITVECQGLDRTLTSDKVQRAVQDIQVLIKPLAVRNADGQPTPDTAVMRWSSESMITQTYNAPYLEDLAPDDPEYPKNFRDPNFTPRDLSDGIIIRSHLPGGQDSKPMRQKTHTYFSASVAMTVRFCDFARLRSFTDDVFRRPLVINGNVSWLLTDKTRALLRTEAIREAYLDAFAKARAYADAMGLKIVRPMQITESSAQTPLDNHVTSGSYRSHVRADKMPASNAIELAYVPKDLPCNVKCQVIFEAE